MHRSASALLCLALVACASPTQEKVGTAATTPLSDLNLVRAPIPPVLAAAQSAPYKLPPDTGCAAVLMAIQELDEVLGPDLDAPSTPSNPSLVERGGSAAEDAATGALQRTAEGVIPFRGWIRKLTGAERYSRQVAAAITAGAARRAFLKGLNAGHGCP